MVEDGIAAPPARAQAGFALPGGLAGHVPGCACCVPRSAVGQAFGRLFLARARGEVAWFDAVAVLATSAGEAAVRAALAADQVSAGRFRLVER